MVPADYRARLLDLVLPALQREAAIIACWEGGARATGRADQFSDVDLVIVAPLAGADNVFATLEGALETLAPISHRWHVEPPGFPGTRQRFYFLANAPRFFALDVVIVEPDGAAQFLERERHGEPQVFFDRSGTIHALPLDRAALARRHEQRTNQLRTSLPVFQMLVDKELARGRPLEAYGFYLVLLRGLVETLGMQHRPDRFDFGWRYVERELPPAARERLRHYAFIADDATLASRARELAAELQQLLER
jgi:hypothetical protein